MLRRQAAELFFFIPMKTFSAFILGILFPIIVFSQTPIWKSINVAPSNSISFLPSPNGKPFGLQYSEGRIYIWDEEQKRWINDYNVFFDCKFHYIYSLANFGENTFITADCSENPLYYNITNGLLSYRTKNGKNNRKKH